MARAPGRSTTRGSALSDRVPGGYVGPMTRLSGFLGLIALAIVLAVVGLAYTAVKWLLIVAVVIFLLGVLRAFVGSRGGTSRPDSH